MSSNLFSFIWKFSARQQIFLLILTVASFPVLYCTLSLPKLILNSAIEGKPTWIHDFVPGLGQLGLLWALSCLLLALIVANGYLKMRLSIYRGLIGERLIRRLRYAMLERSLERPLRGGPKLSQGEAVSMVTAEAEPLAGIMGDAFAQPVFQLGQMLTILAFLFLQNVWLGLAGISLIPLQAYLIPRMQRKVNRLQRRRVAEVRDLSTKIGETIAGAKELRRNGGRRYKLAEYSEKLHRMFIIRVEIFNAKYKIKFINNLLTQITPFMFYALGGYLVLQGQLSIGALVAAIAAARDIAEPWRELLMFWNGAQEAASRYTALVRQFRLGKGAVDPQNTTVEALEGCVAFKQVYLHDSNGTPLFNGIDLDFPPGSLIGLQINEDQTRHAVVDLLTGERTPDSGLVTIAGCPVSTIPEEILVRTVGYASSEPSVFAGTVGENIRMPLLQISATQDVNDVFFAEAVRTGNMPNSFSENGRESYDVGTADPWWLQIMDAMGTSEELSERALNVRLNAERHGELAHKLLLLREKVADLVVSEGLSGELEEFSLDGFNHKLSVGENLIFAVQRREEKGGVPDALIDQLIKLPFVQSLVPFSADMAAVLVRSFGELGADHPLLRKITSLTPADFRELQALAPRLDEAIDQLTADDRFTLMKLLFQVKARDATSPVSDQLKELVVGVRPQAIQALDGIVDYGYQSLDRRQFNYNLTILENLMWGTLRSGSEDAQGHVRQTIIKFISENGLEEAFRLLIADVQVGLSGENLSTVTKERLSFARALIRKPTVVILDRAMSSSTEKERSKLWHRIHEILPSATIVVMEREGLGTDGLDRVYKIARGEVERSDAIEQTQRTLPAAVSMLDDQQRKCSSLSKVREFQGLRSAQLEVLAFASKWETYAAGSTIFRAGQPTDGVYLITSGEAELRWSEDDYAHVEPLAVVKADRLIGDLSVILNGPRVLSLVTVTDVTCLKIGSQDFRDIYESDINVALLLLRTIGGHLQEAGQELELMYRTANKEIAIAFQGD
jgi:ABC-type multidrug transport system fused ATPase/permease subunit